MQQIQGGKFSQALQDEFAAQGKLDLQLDGVVSPVVLLADVSQDAAGFRAHGSAVPAAGGAGNRSVMQIALPDALRAFGSSLRLKRMTVSASSNATFLFGRSPGLTGGTVITSKEWRDTGRQGFPQAVLQTRNNAAVPAGAPTAGRVFVLANESKELQLDWIIRPGDTRGFMVYPAVDNLGITVWMEWLEVPPR